MTNVRSHTVNGISVEVVECGRGGQPLLFLHPEIGLRHSEPALECLAADWRVIAPSHPGFGASQLHKAMTTVDDLAYFYLDLIEELDLHDAVVVGSSFGGWIAAEIAVKSTARISRLVLSGSYGIKISGRESRDIVDMFSITQDQLSHLSYLNKELCKVDLTAKSDDELRVIARNRESTVRFGWSPYMHDPKLMSRLRRIRIPTLVLWGESDAIVSPDYGRAFAAAIAGAEFRLVPAAGHYPHVEQPDNFAAEVTKFCRSGETRSSDRVLVLSDDSQPARQDR